MNGRRDIFKHIIKYEYGMNVAMFARATGVRESVINNILNGRTTNIETRKKLLKVLTPYQLEYLTEVF